MDENELKEPVAESPDVVFGGPLDPKSAEGRHPPVGAETESQEVDKAQEPLHRGLLGDIKTQDELRSYTKQLEDLFVSAKTAQPVPLPSAAVPVPTPLEKTDARARFADKIFSNPDEAFDIAVQEATDRFNTVRNAERQREEFWKDFYVKNADLSRVDRVVQSVVKERAVEISKINDAKQLSDYISNEARKVIDLVKKETGHTTETKLPSGSVASVGGSREPVPQVRQVKKPASFIDQIRAARPGKKR